MYNTQDPFFVFKKWEKVAGEGGNIYEKKVVSLLIAGLMVLEPCTMADAADLSDTEVIEQSVESAGDSVETEAMGETPEETGDIAESGAQELFRICRMGFLRSRGQHSTLPG